VPGIECGPSHPVDRQLRNRATEKRARPNPDVLAVDNSFSIRILPYSVVAANTKEYSGVPDAVCLSQITFETQQQKADPVVKPIPPGSISATSLRVDFLIERLITQKVAAQQVQLGRKIHARYLKKIRVTVAQVCTIANGLIVGVLVGALALSGIDKFKRGGKK